MRTIKFSRFAIALVILSLLVSACAPLPTTLQVMDTPVPTARETAVPTLEPSPTETPTATPEPTETLLAVCEMTPEEVTRKLFSGEIKVDDIAAVPLISPENTSEYLRGGEAVMAEIKLAIQHQVEQLIANGHINIAIPEFAQDLASQFDGVNFFVQTAPDGVIQAAPEGYYTVEANGFAGGEWGVFVRDGKGRIEAIVPEETSMIEGWLMDPLGPVRQIQLPAQMMWGEMMVVKENGCGWMIVQVDSDHNVVAVMKATGDLEKINDIWVLPGETTPVAAVARELGIGAEIQDLEIIDHPTLGTQILWSETKGVMGVYYEGEGWVSRAGWPEAMLAAETNFNFDHELIYEPRLRKYSLTGVTDGKLIETPFEIPTSEGTATSELAYNVYYLDAEGRLQVVAVPIIVWMPDGTKFFPELFGLMDPGMEEYRKTEDQVMALIQEQLTVPGRVIMSIFYPDLVVIEKEYQLLAGRGNPYPEDHPYMLGLELTKTNLETEGRAEAMVDFMAGDESSEYIISVVDSGNCEPNPQVIEFP